MSVRLDTSKAQAYGVIAMLLACLKALLPSFLLAESDPSQSLIPKRRPTSYLDGLKGLASWIVFNTHLSPLLSRRMGAGWGHDDNSKTFLQLPFVHLFHAGGFPIHIFFVINGAILSFSTVKAMDLSPQDPAAMMKKISLAAFRRPLRLFLPAFASTVIVFILLRLDVFHAVDVYKDDTLYFGWPLLRTWAERKSSIWEQGYDWLERNARMFRIVERQDGIDYSNPYNSPMWTSAIQYQGAILINISHAACFYINRRGRMATLIGIIGVSIFARQYLFLSFLLGWMVAELHVRSSSTRQPELLTVESQEEKSPPRRRLLPVIYYSLALIVGLYLASYPRYEPEKTDGFKFLASITPRSLGVSSDLWHAIAAFLTVYTIGNLSSVQWLLSVNLLRYIGRLSFGIYLTHKFATHIAGILIFDRIWTVTGRSTYMAEATGFVPAYLLTLFVNIWVADIWVRTVEKWCTDLSEKLQEILVTKIPK